MSTRPHTAIRVISLLAALERRQAFVRSAVAAGCDWEFFDAHTTPMRGLSYDEKRVTGIYGRKLHPGELGCYSSHFDLWRWLVQADCEQLVVLEDDVVVDWEFIRDISSIEMASRGIEYLRLFAKMPAPLEIHRLAVLRPIPPSHPLHRICAGHPSLRSLEDRRRAPHLSWFEHRSAGRRLHGSDLGSWTAESRRISVPGLRAASAVLDR